MEVILQLNKSYQISKYHKPPAVHLPYTCRTETNLILVLYVILACLSGEGRQGVEVGVGVVVVNIKDTIYTDVFVIF